MSDRELLKLAAKAYGIDTNRCLQYENGGFDWHEKAGTWNPLTDDGDALRLAVKLGMTINPYQEGVFVSRFEGEEVVAEPFEVIGQPDTAATRRAIVRAAAEIGRRMR